MLPSTLKPAATDPNRESELKRLQNDPTAFGADHSKLVEQRENAAHVEAKKAGRVASTGKPSADE